MKTILIIDDDPQIRRAISRQLKSFGYNVTASDDGSDAIKRFERGELFDAIICDFDMPTSGKIVFEKYKKCFPNRTRRFVFHTAETNFPMLYGVRVFPKPSKIQNITTFLKSLP